MAENIHDVAVVGAGPAGLAAAVTAAEAGAQVLLLDAATQPGGQYWRHRDETTHADDPRGHHDWSVFTDLRARLRAAMTAGRIDYRPGTSVWLLERAGAGFRLRTTPTVGCSPAPRLGLCSDTSRSAGATGAAREAPTSSRDSTHVARRLVLCPGAYDRQLPVPGWDLPGVMAAGGAQALLKGHGVLAGRRVVVAGTGPFLLPVATGLADAGASVVALCEAAHPSRWARHLPAAARQGPKLLQAGEYAARLARRGVRLRTRTVVTEILGEDRVTAVRLGRVDGRGRVAGEGPVLPADAVALGWGFTPQLELPLMLGTETAMGADGGLVVRVDPDQRSSVPGVLVAGEATGIGGASLAVAEGLVAGAAAAGREPDPRHRRAVLAHRAFARAMHDVYPVPAEWSRWTTPGTLVCRCEEVTAGDLTRACRDLAAEDPREARSLTRAGMGRCQGRVCGWATAAILADRTGRDVTEEDLLATGRRPLAAPVTLGALAALDGAADDQEVPLA
ncbi:NADP-dependent aldehyde dehydrogenase [Georgenia soli]|uniref:NADP-dependent aldehyde dehydrogenase n=1 Tax=Georgenia soli TaxID=638953 RepID=A0A2A9EMX8_9MICO|nr:NAD(P)/FAD-dependent oxidoreductase [Georgenia soli]PFG39569.1 NADP-dependent aldehyde dehydrogenase [Georgenia soli]